MAVVVVVVVEVVKELHPVHPHVIILVLILSRGVVLAELFHSL